MLAGVQLLGSLDLAPARRVPLVRDGLPLVLMLSPPLGELVAAQPLGPSTGHEVQPRGGEPARGYPANPNGSVGAIAGITNPTGNVLGLMPHPERHLRALHHPGWTFRAALQGLPPDEERAGDGYPLFERAVRHLRADG